MSKRLNAVITQEEKWYVARCVELGVVSQGKTIEEAKANLKEAVELYLESFGSDGLAERQPCQPPEGGLPNRYPAPRRPCERNAPRDSQAMRTYPEELIARLKK